MNHGSFINQPPTNQQIPIIPPTASMASLNRYYESSPFPTNPGVTMPYGKFNTAFNPAKSIPFNGSQPKSMFNNHDFINRGDLLHNDLYDNVLREEIREYSILIDSKDRNFDVYPNPFCYKVTFNPGPTTRTKVNGKTIIYETSNPVIYERMYNVRYISLEKVILPLYTKIRRKNDDGCEVDITQCLTDYLYIVMVIEEYSDVNCRSTNDVLSSSFVTIYFDEVVNKTHYIGKTRGGIKVFQPDELGEIISFTIKFMNPYGEILSVNHFDKEINSISGCCICEDDEIADDCFRHNLFHPLHPAFQHHLNMSVGVIEPRFNKVIFS